MACRHCRRTRATRPRGLCWHCYFAPGVRDLYPVSGKFAARGLGLANAEPPPPAERTRALPGTEEKVAALARRVEAGEGLWHPDDGRGE